MDKTKSVVSFFFPIILISFSIQSNANQEYSRGLESPDSMQLIFEQRIIDSVSDSLKSVEAHFDFGEYFAGEGETEASIEQFEIALRIARNIKNDNQIANVANYLANMYAAIGDFKTSNETYQIALASAEKMQNGGEIAKISMNLASNYNYTSDYEFASLTRATLNNSAAETISLSDEIDMLKNYTELEKMRKGDKFDYEILYDDNLETDFIQIPPMLVQPFVENSFNKDTIKILNLKW